MKQLKFLLARIATAVSMAVVLSACTPLVNHPGKETTPPKIENNYFIAADGVMLPLRSWLPKSASISAVIVALHGFNDYSNAFASPGAYLNNRGIACYAYDQRGFGGAPGRGLWSGVEAYTRDLNSFVKVIRARHSGIPVYLLGESMGGAITIVSMAGNDPPEVDGVILVAPAVWGRDTMPWYQRWLLAGAAYTVPWLELTGKGVRVTPSDNVEMRRSLGRDPLVIKSTRVDSLHGLSDLMDAALAQAGKLRVPTLVLYGKYDEVIPKEPTLRMLGTMPPTVRRAFYDNGYHMLLRDLQGDKPLADIAAWIGDHQAPLPHGTDHWN